MKTNREWILLIVLTCTLVSFAIYSDIMARKIKKLEQQAENNNNPAAPSPDGMSDLSTTTIANSTFSGITDGIHSCSDATITNSTFVFPYDSPVWHEIKIYDGGNFNWKCGKKNDPR